MKVFQTADKLVIKENPGCLWLFGLFFAALGILLVYGAFNGFVLFGIEASWAGGLTFLSGLSGIVVGLSAIYKTPIHNLEIDKTAKQVTILRWGIFGNRETIYYFDEIEKFCLIESRKLSDSTVWSFGLKLINGENIPITSLGQYAEDYENKFVYPVNVFTGKELPSCQLSFEPPDESEDEIS